jgi:hypothetical protein
MSGSRWHPHVRGADYEPEEPSFRSKSEVGEGALAVEVGDAPRHLTGADVEQIRSPLRESHAI